MGFGRAETVPAVPASRFLLGVGAVGLVSRVGPLRPLGQVDPADNRLPVLDRHTILR